MYCKRLSLAVAGLLALLSTRAAAQNTCTGNPCSVNNTAQVNVGTVLRLTLSSTTTALTSPNEAAFDQGYQDDNGPTAGVKSNRPWNLQISANAATWTGANGARANKPAGELEWSRTNSGYASLTTSPVSIYGSSQSATGNASQGMSYRTLWSYASDTPGDYSLVVVYTLTAP